MTYRKETRSSRSVAEVNILRLCSSRGLNACGCRLAVMSCLGGDGGRTSPGLLGDIKVPKWANLNGQNHFLLDNLRNSYLFPYETMFMSFLL